jgi:DegV family protein with EDD domain
MLSRSADSILCITLSAKMSTLHNTAVAAREQVKGELAHTTIEVMDSGIVTGAEGFVVLAAAQAAAEGKGLVDTIEAAERVREKVELVFVLETIRHAYRTGRIPKIATQVGAWLSIKPVLSWGNGVARFNGMTRSKEKGVDQLLKIMRRKVGTKPVHVAVHHANALEEGERLMERVRAQFDCVEAWLTEFSPVMGAGFWALPSIPKTRPLLPSSRKEGLHLA